MGLKNSKTFSFKSESGHLKPGYEHLKPENDSLKILLNESKKINENVELNDLKELKNEFYVKYFFIISVT